MTPQEKELDKLKDELIAIMNRMIYGGGEKHLYPPSEIANDLTDKKLLEEKIASLTEQINQSKETVTNKE